VTSWLFHVFAAATRKARSPIMQSHVGTATMVEDEHSHIVMIILWALTCSPAVFREKWHTRQQKQHWLVSELFLLILLFIFSFDGFSLFFREGYYDTIFHSFSCIEVSFVPVLAVIVEIICGWCRVGQDRYFAVLIWLQCIIQELILQGYCWNMQNISVNIFTVTRN